MKTFTPNPLQQAKHCRYYKVFDKYLTLTILCGLLLGGFASQVKAQPANDLCANAQAITAFNAIGDCTNGVTGTTINATDDGGVPNCDTSGGPYQDVWYSFNSGYHIAMQVGLIAPTLPGGQLLSLQVLDACGGTVIQCDFNGINFPAPFTVTPSTNYVFRVYSNIAFDTPVDFTVCLQGNNIKRWAGTTSTDWFDATNWIPNDAPPTADQSVTIPDGAPNYPIINAWGAVARNVLIEAAASIEVQTASLLTVDGQNSIDDGVHNLGTLTNSGNIEVRNTNDDGIETRGTTTNNPSGIINIDGTNYGLYAVGGGTVINNDRIKMGETTPIGNTAIFTQPSATGFTNETCGLIHIFSDDRILDNGDNFTNNGSIVSNSSVPNDIDTNTGIVQNIGGGTFTITTNSGILSDNLAKVYWTGCADIHWTNGDNWHNGQVPVTSSQVEILTAANEPILLSASGFAETLILHESTSLSLIGQSTLLIDAVNNTEQAEKVRLQLATLFIGFGCTMTIQNSNWDGLFNSGGTIVNNGTLYVTDAFFRGINNVAGTLTNSGTGTISLMNTDMSNGGTVINLGIMDIDKLGVGIFHDAGTFTNESCALIETNGNILDDGNSFTNNGTIIESSTDNSDIETNNRTVYNLNGGAFTVTTGTAPLTTLPNPTANTWTGAIDTDWSSCGNWTKGRVPNGNQDVVIPVTANSPIANDLNLLVNATYTLTIETGASMYVNGDGTGGFPDDGINNLGSLQIDGSLYIDNYSHDGINNQGNIILNGLLDIQNTGASAMAVRSGDSFTINEGGTYFVDNVESAFWCTGAIHNMGMMDINNMTVGGINLALAASSLINDGTIDMSNPVFYGIFNIGTATNNGTIIINSVNDKGIENSGIFDNNSCAVIQTNSRIIDNATFTNNGTISESSTNNSNVDTNNGTIYNLNGGTFTVNNGAVPLTMLPTTYTWTGAEDSDWSKGCNWDSGIVPNGNQDVVIPDVANDPVATAIQIDINAGFTMTVETGATLTIDGLNAISDGIHNLGTLTNSGTIDISNTNDDAIETQGTVTNNSSGEIVINACNYGLYTVSGGSLTNNGRIDIGETMVLGNIGILTAASGTGLTNSSCATIEIHADNRILDSGNYFVNDGTIISNSSQANDIETNTGIVHNLGGGTFTITTNSGILSDNPAKVYWTGCAISNSWLGNQNWHNRQLPMAGSQIEIRDVSNQPVIYFSIGLIAETMILHANATLTIDGSLTIDAVYNLDESEKVRVNGGASLNINEGGSLSIINSNWDGLFNQGGVITNQGILNVTDATIRGINNDTGMVTNTVSGVINLANTDIHNSDTFTNYGQIVINVGLEGIDNQGGTFTNENCALIETNGNILDDGNSFTNNGTIVESSTGASDIETNNGTVFNLNGGTFNIANNTGTVSATLVNPTTNTWTGAIDTDWSNCENWTKGQVPNGNQDVVIPNVANDPYATAIQINIHESYTMTIDNDASLTVDGLHIINDGIYNSGTLIINGDLNISNVNQNAMVVFNGILNINQGATFTFSNVNDGISNQGGTVTNMGVINGSNITTSGIFNGRDLFYNSGTFDNIGGTIVLDNVAFGLFNNWEGTFTNDGGYFQVLNSTIESIENKGTFFNNPCSTVDLVSINDDLALNYPFTNNGIVIENGTGNSLIDTNNGTLYNLNGGTFTVNNGAAPLTSLPTVYTWTGAEDTDWNNACNWDSGIVPDGNQDVVIPEVYNSAIATDVNLLINAPYSLTIESNGALLVDGGGNEGDGIDNKGTIQIDGFLFVDNYGQDGINNDGNIILNGYLEILNTSTDAMEVRSGATFTINSGGTYYVSNVRYAFGCEGLVHNMGTMDINNTTIAGIHLILGASPFINDGTINISNSNGHGILSNVTLTNNGIINIEDAGSDGIHNNGPILVNNGILSISNTGENGISNSPFKSMENNGTVEVTNTSHSGIRMVIGASLTNNANIIINTGGSHGILASGGSGPSINTACGIIQTNAKISDANQMTNEGGIVESSPEDSGIDTNNGIIHNLGGGTFTITNNNGALSTNPNDLFWTGCEDANWMNPNNWHSGQIPIATSLVTILSSPNDPILSNPGAVAETVFIAQTASLTINSGGDLVVDAVANAESVSKFKVDWSANCTIQAGGSLTVQNSTFDGIGVLGTLTNEGDIVVDNINFPGLVVFAGSLLNDNGGTIHISNATEVGLRAYGNGTINNDNGSTITIENSGQTSGAIDNIATSGTFNNLNNSTIIVTGGGTSSINLAGPNSHFVNSTCSYISVTNDINIVDAASTFTNGGLLDFRGTSFANSGTFTNTDGYIYDPNGSMNCPALGGTCLDFPLTYAQFQSNPGGNSGHLCLGDAGDLAAYVGITFQVDMSNEIVPPEGVHIAGTFQGWEPGSTPMTNVPGTSIWEYTRAFLIDEYIEYKFINGDEWGEDEILGDDICTILTDVYNRFLTIPSSTTTLEPVCFTTCNACDFVPSVTAHINVFLEGPYDGAGQMTTALVGGDLLPITQPFGRSPWNYQGPESVPTLGDIPSAATDWLLIELRDPTDVMVMVAQRACFLLQDGTLQDVDGNAGVNFNGLPVGDYYVIVRSRNHLANLSTFTHFLPNDLASTVDFTDPANVAGVEQLADMGDGNFAQLAGDFNSDGVVTVADFNLYQTQSSQLNLYLDGDCNLDKAVTVADFNFYQSNASKLAVTEVRY